jgi:hypothetical protein
LCNSNLRFGKPPQQLRQIAEPSTSVLGHRLLEMTTATLKNEASAIQEYSFA